MMVADFKIHDCLVIPQEALLPNYRGRFLEQHKSGEKAPKRKLIDPLLGASLGTFGRFLNGLV